MKQATMRNILRRVRTLEQLDELAKDFTPEWAGCIAPQEDAFFDAPVVHKGRLKVVRMIERKRRVLEAKA